VVYLAVKVLICGGTDWPKLGRKERGGKTENLKGDQNPDLLEPYILRSLSNVKAASVHTSCCGCHVVVLDVDGVAWMFGRNTPAVLGVPRVDAVSENAPINLEAKDLGAAKGTKFVHATLTILVGDDGQVWTVGVNNLGQVRDSGVGGRIVN